MNLTFNLSRNFLILQFLLDSLLSWLKYFTMSFSFHLHITWSKLFLQSYWWFIIIIGSFILNRKSAKLKSAPNFPAIQYFVLPTIIYSWCYFLPYLIYCSIVIICCNVSRGIYVYFDFTILVKLMLATRNFCELSSLCHVFYDLCH